MDIKEEELPHGNVNGQLIGDQQLMAERVAVVWPGGALRINEFIERIIARDNFERPDSPLARMPAPFTSQRAVPSGLNAHLPPFSCR